MSVIEVKCSKCGHVTNQFWADFNPDTKEWICHKCLDLAGDYEVFHAGSTFKTKKKRCKNT